MSLCLLFNLRYTLCNNLSFLFTELFNEGVLPPVWLASTVTPVFKKGSVSDPANYRPISLTCIACCVMEKIVKDIFGPLIGRPYGGTALLIKNRLARYTVNLVSNDRFTAVLVADCLVISAYMPCSGIVSYTHLTLPTNREV